jgi:hypothetical protein
MNTSTSNTLHPSNNSRMLAAALAVVLTLSMLMGVNHLASPDAAAHLMAQAAPSQA